MLYIGNRTFSHSAEAQRALHAADGYLYLGLPEDALDELDSVPDPEQANSSVMLARVRVLLHLRKWPEAEELSGVGAVQHPAEEEFTVQRAFALHQLDKGAEAVEVIQAAPEWLRRTGILHYNLACYEARLGNLSTARQCIRAAIKINAAMKKNARVDPDLQSLWN
jgi:predicted Zn-dependent protease